MSNYYSRREIAELIEKTPQYVGMLITRGKLTEKNKKIDTDLKKNKICLSKFITKEIERKEDEEEYGEENTSSSGSPKNSEVRSLDIRIKQHLKLKIVRTAKEELDLAKKQGKLIGILESKDVMQRAATTIGAQFRQMSKQYINEVAAKYNIPDSDIAGLQKNFDTFVNRAVKEAKELIEIECRAVADEFSETLNQGESKL